MPTPADRPLPTETGHDAPRAPGVASGHTLVEMSGTHLELPPGEPDPRGCSVLDRNGDPSGVVENLVVDEIDRRVRFLAVGKGGFLGWGRTHRLVPVEAIVEVDVEHAVVRVDTTRDVVSASPVFDPTLERWDSDWSPYYGAYAHPPLVVPEHRRSDTDRARGPLPPM